MANWQLGDSEENQSTAKDVDDSIAKSDVANALERIAEREFEEQFIGIYQIAKKTIRLRKISYAKNDVTKDLSLIASRANVQATSYEEKQTQTNSGGSTVARSNSAIIDSTNFAFVCFLSKSFVCTLAQKPTKVRKSAMLKIVI